MTTELLAATWESTGWDDPRVAALRAGMDTELRPRYARPDGSRRAFPPAPTADEIVVTWLARLGSEPAATASLRRLEIPGEPVRYEVKRVFVAASARRRGLAARALQLVEDSARALGVDRLVLQTGDRQPEAVALYEREGWTAIPIYRPYDIAPHSRCYAKEL